eukprot:2725496-Rhodomonas_salina.2
MVKGQRSKVKGQRSNRGRGIRGRRCRSRRWRARCRPASPEPRPHVISRDRARDQQRPHVISSARRTRDQP